MVIDTNEQTYSKAANACITGVTNNLKQRRIWTRCPRCIGGNMYQEHKGEYVCIQCGCSYYPDRVTKTQQPVKTI
jgi:uncharacterized protein (DUF983 family)